MFDPLSDWQRVKNAVHLALRNFERLALRGGARRTICAVAAASLSGTFFLTHQTPCSFCLSDMLISIVYTTELYHLGRFKRLIVQDIQAFQGLRGTLALPTGRSGPGLICRWGYIDEGV